MARDGQETEKRVGSTRQSDAGGSPPRAATPEDDMLFLLAQAHREVQTSLSRVLSAYDLPVEQWRVLTALSDREGLTISALSERVSLNISALSKIVDRMVSRSLVSRRRDSADNRRVIVFITDFGLEIVAQKAPEVDALWSDLTAQLGPEDADAFTRILRRLARPSAVDRTQ